jgi:hypothetical protein
MAPGDTTVGSTPMRGTKNKERVWALRSRASSLLKHSTRAVAQMRSFAPWSSMRRMSGSFLWSCGGSIATVSILMSITKTCCVGCIRHPLSLRRQLVRSRTSQQNRHLNHCLRTNRPNLDAPSCNRSSRRPMLSKGGNLTSYGAGVEWAWVKEVLEDCRV